MKQVLCKLENERKAAIAKLENGQYTYYKGMANTYPNKNYRQYFAAFFLLILP